MITYVMSADHVSMVVASNKACLATDVNVTQHTMENTVTRPVSAIVILNDL